jgi:hypothetical protein
MRLSTIEYRWVAQHRAFGTNSLSRRKGCLARSGSGRCCTAAFTATRPIVSRLSRPELTDLVAYSAPKPNEPSLQRDALFSAQRAARHGAARRGTRCVAWHGAAEAAAAPQRRLQDARKRQRVCPVRVREHQPRCGAVVACNQAEHAGVADGVHRYRCGHATFRYVVAESVGEHQHGRRQECHASHLLRGLTQATQATRSAATLARSAHHTCAWRGITSRRSCAGSAGSTSNGGLLSAAKPSAAATKRQTAEAARTTTAASTHAPAAKRAPYRKDRRWKVEHAQRRRGPVVCAGRGLGQQGSEARRCLRSSLHHTACVSAEHRRHQHRPAC